MELCYWITVSNFCLSLFSNYWKDRLKWFTQKRITKVLNVCYSIFFDEHFCFSKSFWSFFLSQNLQIKTQYLISIWLFTFSHVDLNGFYQFCNCRFCPYVTVKFGFSCITIYSIFFFYLKCDRTQTHNIQHMEKRNMANKPSQNTHNGEMSWNIQCVQLFMFIRKTRVRCMLIWWKCFYFTELYFISWKEWVLHRSHIVCICKFKLKCSLNQLVIFLHEPFRMRYFIICLADKCLKFVQ